MVELPYPRLGEPVKLFNVSSADRRIVGARQGRLQLAGQIEVRR